MTSRRALLQDMLAIATASIPVSEIWARTKPVRAPANPVLERLCDLVIPPTDTPGAVEAGVPAFVQAALAAGLRDASVEAYHDFLRVLDAKAGGSFIALPAPGAQALLAAIDGQAFAQRQSADGVAPDAAAAHWRALKALIVIGYYTSEAGGSRELMYELVPGRFEGDVPLAREPRAWSSDWTGVKYA